MKKNLTILIALMLWAGGVSAQQDTAARAIRLLGERYLHAPQLSFDVEYRYASEAEPGIWLDSLHGSFKMDGARYWYLLDSTEMLCGDKYVVVLYREDKVMYLSTAAAAPAVANPLAVLDSFLVKKQGLHYSLTSSAQQTIITIYFDPSTNPAQAASASSGQAYKKIEYYIDNNTRLLIKMISVVKSEQLYDPAVRKQVSGENSYAIIETLFRNYREKSFDGQLFNTAHYFKKEATGFVTVAPYTNYKIFLGKPGL